MHPNLSHRLLYFLSSKTQGFICRKKESISFFNFCEDLFFFFFLLEFMTVLLGMVLPTAGFTLQKKIKPGVLSKSKLYFSLICISAFSKFRCGVHKVVVHMVFLFFFNTPALFGQNAASALKEIEQPAMLGNCVKCSVFNISFFVRFSFTSCWFI